MKEKSKKILKGVGVGALACVAMLGFTGCSNIKVDQSEVDKLIQSVETLKQQSLKMTKEEVWNFAQIADYNLMMNTNGLRDNLVISQIDEKLGLQQDMMLYYNNDSVKVFAQLYDGAELWYQTSESNVILADIDKAGTGYMCSDLEEHDENHNFELCIGVYRGGLPTIDGMFGLTYEDLNHYEILENGNVKLTFVQYETYYQDEEETEYITNLNTTTFEYSNEGKLISVDMSVKMIEKTGGVVEVIDTNYDIKCTLSYGTVDTELLESWVEVAEEYRAEQE